MATVGQPAGPGAMRRITVHYTNSPTRNRTAADADLDDDLIHLVFGDVLQDQEGLHQSIMDGAYINQNHMRRGGPDHSQSEQHYHGESSTAAAATAEQQIASDLEYAKRLQEMEDLAIEDDDDISCVPSPSDTDSDDDHDNNDEQALQDDRQNGDDDPDNMTYEERQELGESVGSESRGLSDELISYLQPWKLRSSGFFSKKTNNEDCTICLNTFKHRESLITLPCKHNYHEDCIATWLKINKTCPVCKYEVFGPS